MKNKKWTDKLINSYSEFIIKWRWPVIFLAVSSALFVGSFVRFLEPSNDYRLFFSEEYPQLKSFEEMQNVYTKNDNILFVIAPKDGVVFKKSTLSAIEDLVEKSWRIPFTLRVDAVTNYQHTEVDNDDLTVEDLIYEVENMDADNIRAALIIATMEPLMKNRIISENGKVTGINVTLHLPEKDVNEVSVAVKYARKLKEEFLTSFPEHDVYLTGFTMLSNAFTEYSLKDMATLVPLMYLAIVIISYIALRSIGGTIITLSLILLSVIVGMGFAGFMGIKITPPSSVAPTMIMTLAVADSIHLLLSMLDEMKKGKTKRAALKESLRINMQPVFLTSLSTAVGFLSMNFSESPPFHDLGNMTAVGISAAFIFSVTILPALAAVIPFKVAAVKKFESNVKYLEKFSDFVTGNSRKLLWVTSAVLIISVYAASKNELNDQFIDYFDESIEFRIDTDYTSENLTGIYQIEHSIGAGESGGISNPEYLKYLDEFDRWYENQPEVIHVNSYTKIIKRLNKNMNQDNEDFYRVPEKRDLAAQYLLLYEMSLPFGLDLNNMINVDKSATRFTVTLDKITTKELRELSTRAETWLRNNAPRYMFAFGSGTSIMFAHISKRNINGMLLGTGLAIFIISFILIFAFKSPKFGMFSLIPNLAPGIIAFGIWGMLVGQIGIALSVVSGMTIGIVVDDSIHFLSKYLRARREKNLDSKEAVKYAFISVGKALIVTSVILVIGFSVLSMSSFELNAGMGKLTAITIIVALIVDFTMLPALLVTIDGAKVLKFRRKLVNRSKNSNALPVFAEIEKSQTNRS